MAFREAGRDIVPAFVRGAFAHGMDAAISRIVARLAAVGKKTG
jgi:uncharacterized membrane protein YgcG